MVIFERSKERQSSRMMNGEKKFSEMRVEMRRSEIRSINTRLIPCGVVSCALQLSDLPN